MADDTRATDLDTPEKEDEPAPPAEHEAAEGGVLGVIGGAIVGGLAGGPIGAVIGAVLGGIASAGAVEAVEQHDHKDTEHGDEVPAGSTLLPDDTASVPPGEVSTPMTPLEQPAAPDLGHQIQQRAYEIYVQRGRSDGHDVEDWLQAEREILAG